MNRLNIFARYNDSICFLNPKNFWEVEMSKLVERFLNYVAFDTQSARDSDETPSSAKQLRLAEFLV